MCNFEQPILCNSFHNISVLSTENSFPRWTSPAVVLCIDDDEGTLAVMKWTVETNGYSALTSSNWRGALEIFQRHAIDLVIVDYEMPDMSGYEISLLIRSLSPEVPIILHSDSLDVSELARQRTDACIPKGTEPSVLIAAISTLIMKNREQNETNNVRGEENANAA